METGERKEYFEKRAADERLAADQAGDERAAELHRELARRYDELATGPETPPSEVPADLVAGIPSEFRILP